MAASAAEWATEAATAFAGCRRSAVRLHLLEQLLFSCTEDEMVAVAKLCARARHRVDVLGCLPQELVDQVAAHLTGRDLARLCGVSTAWNRLISHSLAWHTLHVRATSLFPHGRRWPGAGGVACKEAYTEVQRRLSRLARFGRLETLGTGDGLLGRALAVDADGARVVCGSDGRQALVYTDNKLTRHIKCHSCSCIRLQGAVLYTGSFDRTIQAWNAETGDNIATFVGHTAAVFCMAVDAGRSLLATGGADSVVRVWNTATTQQIGVLPQGLRWVRQVEFCGDRRLVVLAQTIRIFDCTAADPSAWPLVVCLDHTGSITLTPTGDIVALEKCALLQIRARDGATVCRRPLGFESSERAVIGLCGSFAVVAERQSFRVLALETLQAVRVFDAVVNCVRCDADGRVLLGSEGRFLQLRTDNPAAVAPADP